MSRLTITGLVLAAAGLGVLVAAVRDCLRRRRVPSLRYGARTAGGGWLRVLWLAVLVAGWAGGAFGAEVASRERRRPTPAPAASARGSGERSVLRVPFFVRERARRPRPGDASPVVITREAVTLPWSFLAALALYAVFVAAWPVAGGAGAGPGDRG